MSCHQIQRVRRSRSRTAWLGVTTRRLFTTLIPVHTASRPLTTTTTLAVFVSINRGHHGKCRIHLSNPHSYFFWFVCNVLVPVRNSIFYGSSLFPLSIIPHISKPRLSYSCWFLLIAFVLPKFLSFDDIVVY